MALILGAKTFKINDISAEGRGILGGPVALAALLGAPDRVPMDVALGAGDPAEALPEPSSDSSRADLSTGTLDGGSYIAQAPHNHEEEKSPSLLAKSGKEAKDGKGDNNDKTSAATSKTKAQAAEKSSGKPEKTEKKVSTSGRMVQPASGRKGAIHGNNGVDISNSCGTSVIAAAAGTVVNDPMNNGFGSWNHGYGNVVMIKHPNGTRTRYAHLSKVSVAPGQAVQQGQQIGKIGNTGQVRGKTGCHLHFEVLGGVNPFASR